MEANVTELWRMVETMQEELEEMGTAMDSLWLMLGAILVVFMQAGFAMLEVGSVPAKHTKNLLVKNLLDLAVAAVMWWSFGWGIAFGTEGDSGFNQFVGPGTFFSRGEEFRDEDGGYGTAEGYSWALWLFQVVRWGWNANGWASAWSDTRSNLLFGCGAIDFAGSGVVHATGGMAALVLVILMGPRLDRFSDKGVSRKMERQSVIMQALGAFILWVGWYGFNGCSTLFITGSSHTAAKAMVCTTLAAAAGGLGVACLSLIMFQHVGPDQVINGILSGLVAITAGCAVVEVEGAFLIGTVSSILYLGVSRLLELVRIDDMVDAAPVHLANGVWGILAAGLFATEEGYSAAYYAERSHQCCGFLYGCGMAQLSANALFIVVIMAWVTVTTLLIGFAIKFMGILRISHLTERAGTDSVAHGGSEMPEFAKNMLSRIEALAAKAAYTETNEATGSSSHPGQHVVSNRSGFSGASNISKRSNASNSY